MLLSAPAETRTPQGVMHWFVWKTDQGCLYYFQNAWGDAGNADARKNWYFSIRWEGASCTPGKLINGSGTLVEVGNLKATTGHPGRATNRWQGTMINGLWNGMVTQSDVYPGHVPATYPAHEFRMGCPAAAPNCSPPSGPPQAADFVTGGKS